MSDDQQQDPLKALEDLIAQRKAGAASPPVADVPAEPPAPPQVDTEALQAQARERDAASIENQRTEIAALKDSPQQQAVATQQAAADADTAAHGEFSDDFAIRQIDHTTIPAEDLE